MALRDLGLLLLICLTWAGNSIISKLMVSHFNCPPLFYTAVRFLIVTLAMSPWLLPAPKPVWRMIVVGLCMGAGTFGLTFVGLKTTSPSAMAVIGQLGVPMSTLLSILMLGERIRWRRGIGILLTLIGAILVMWNGATFAPSIGMWFIAASTFTGALGGVMMKQIEDVSPLRLQAWVGFSSLAPLVVLSAVTETGQGAILATAFWPFLWAVLFSGLVVSVIAHTQFYGLIQKYDVNLLQPLTLLSPLATIALGVAITHDPFGPRMALGAAIALVGALIIALRRNHVMAPWLFMRGRIP